MDLLIECKNGTGAIVQEFISKGLTEFVRYEDETPIGIGGHEQGLDWRHQAPDTTTPVIVLLRLSENTYNRLNAISFDNADIVLAAPNGTLFTELLSNTEAKAIYENYYPPHKQYLTEDGAETDIDTGIINPRAGELYIFTDWAK